jgi:formiminotetrahydrofolate cyclodeaminase
VTFRTTSWDGLLEAFSEAGPSPAGAGAAVMAVSISAALCVMTARLSSRHIPASHDIAAEALAMRERLAPLCDMDAERYRRVMAEYRRPDDGDAKARWRRITTALSEASEVPLAVVTAGARLAHLAARLAEEGNPTVRGDAVTAAFLAGAGVEAAGALVRINLAELPDDDRHRVVQDLVGDVATSVERARRTVRDPIGEHSTLGEGARPT